MNHKVWTPKHPEDSRLWQFKQLLEKKYQTDFKDYHQLHAWSVQNPTLFWPFLCDFFDIQFEQPATEILNHYTHMLDARWFTGARFNFAEKLLSRTDHKTAIISICENGNRQVLSYYNLKQQVAACALGLKKAGVVANDRVVAMMPNVAHTIVAMLATTSLGAIWSSCSPDFGAQAAIDRLGQIEPKVLFICDAHQYQGKTHDASDKIKQLKAHIPSLTQIVVCPHQNGNLNLNLLQGSILWDHFLEPTSTLEFASMPFAHPVYIMFSSGTTGKPKCIVHGAGGTLLQHLKELGLHSDLKAADNLCFYTTCGWMMWNWMVSTLALGATLTLYEGSPTFPNANRMFQLIDEEQITVLGTSAKFISTIEKNEMSPKSSHSLQSLRTILATGSPLLPSSYDFVYQHIKSDVQLCSISGGTDIISCFALGNPLLPVYQGELQCLGLGMSVDVFDENGAPIRQKRGELVCTKPFPSMPVGFWHDDTDQTLYHHAYFERFKNVWTHGDFAEITEHGGLIIYGRSDATLNPGGVRIGTAEIYRQIEKIPEVIDSVVIGQDWQDDIRIVLFVKLQDDLQLSQKLIDSIRQTIRQNASPRHVPAKILQVKDVPRTLNGKVVEVAVRQTVHGQPIQNLDALANPEALADFKDREELRN